MADKTKRSAMALLLTLSIFQVACGVDASSPSEPEGLALVADDTFASPAGEAFDPSLDLREVNAIVIDLFGPTDNIAGQAARIAPFPDVFTPPETQLTSISFDVAPEETATDEVGYELIATFGTSGIGAEDATLAYGAELAVLLGHDADYYTVDDAQLGATYWATVGESSINAYETDGRAIVRIEFLASSGLPPGLLDSLEGLRSEIVLGDDAVVRDLRIFADSEYQRYNVGFRFPGLPLEDATALFAAAAQNASWTQIDNEPVMWASATHAAEIQTAVSARGDDSSAMVQYTFSS